MTVQSRQHTAIPLEKTLGNLYAVLEFYNGLEVCAIIIIFFFKPLKRSQTSLYFME